MAQVHGGALVVAGIITAITLLVGPLAVGGCVGYGTYTATQQARAKGIK